MPMKYSYIAKQVVNPIQNSFAESHEAYECPINFFPKINFVTQYIN